MSASVAVHIACQEPTEWTILLFSHRGQTVELVITLRSTLKTARVATVLVESDVLPLLLGDVLLHLAQAVAHHLDLVLRWLLAGSRRRTKISISRICYRTLVPFLAKGAVAYLPTSRVTHWLLESPPIPGSGPASSTLTFVCDGDTCSSTCPLRATMVL